MPYAPIMSNSRLVIKSHAPVRKRLLWVGAVVGLAAAGAALYQAGQGRAGFNSIEAEMEIGALNSEIRDRASQNQTLRAQISVLETAAKIDREAYRRVEDELTELQTKILDQQEDIAF